LRTRTTNSNPEGSPSAERNIAQHPSIVERTIPRRSASRPTHKKQMRPASISRTHSQCQRRELQQLSNRLGRI